MGANARLGQSDTVTGTAGPALGGALLGLVGAWFLGNSIVATVFAVFVLREVGLAPWAFGIVLTVGGVGGFPGAFVAPRLGARDGDRGCE